MKINLTHVLKRNNIDIQTFLKSNDISTYEQLVEYCNSRSLTCLTQEEYTKLTNVDKKQTKRQPKKRAPRRSRKAQNK